MTALDPRPWWLTDPLPLPRAGFWLVRCRLGVAKNKTVTWGPHAPAAIMWLQTQHEPGNPANLMDRSPHLAAFVSGEPVSPWDLFPNPNHEQRRIFHIERALTRAEYDRQMAEIAAARRADRYLPAGVPFKPVSVKDVRIPFL